MLLVTIALTFHNACNSLANLSILYFQDILYSSAFWPRSPGKVLCVLIFGGRSGKQHI